MRTDRRKMVAGNNRAKNRRNGNPAVGKQDPNKEKSARKKRKRHEVSMNRLASGEHKEQTDRNREDDDEPV